MDADSGWSVVRYIDVRDLVQILEAIRKGENRTSYRKQVTRVVRERYPDPKR
jgi:hypothetical protein